MCKHMSLFLLAQASLVCVLHPLLLRLANEERARTCCVDQTKAMNIKSAQWLLPAQSVQLTHRVTPRMERLQLFQKSCSQLIFRNLLSLPIHASYAGISSRMTTANGSKASRGNIPHIHTHTPFCSTAHYLASPSLERYLCPKFASPFAYRISHLKIKPLSC